MPLIFTTSVIRFNPNIPPKPKFYLKAHGVVKNKEEDVIVIGNKADGSANLRLGPLHYLHNHLTKEFVVKTTKKRYYCDSEADMSVKIPWDDVISSDSDLAEYLNENKSWIPSKHEEYVPLADCAECDVAVPQPRLPVRYVSSMGAFKKGPFLKDDKTDLSIVVKGTTFYAHTVILSIEGKVIERMMATQMQERNTEVTIDHCGETETVARSNLGKKPSLLQVIERMMETQMQERKTGEVTIDHCGDGRPVEPHEMRLFLEVYYDRNKFVDYEEDCQKVMAVFRLAEYYEVPDIVEHCVNALKYVAIGPEQLCEAVRIGSLYSHVLPGFLDRCATETKNLPNGYWQLESADIVFADRRVAADFMEALARRCRS